MPNYLKHKSQAKRIVANNPLYSSTKWRKYRQAILMRRGGVCDACHTVPMFERELHIDHIRPISDGGAIYDEANLQVLCIQCHGRKTAGERGWGPISKLDPVNCTVPFSFDQGAEPNPPNNLF